MSRGSLGIVHLLSSFGLGGQERIALDLAVGQQADGHRPIAVTLESGAEGPLGPEFRRRDIEVVHVPKRPGFDARLWLELGGLFRRERVDVVHTHNPQPLIYGGPAARACRVALVHTKHGVNPDSDRRLWMKRAAGWLADSFVAVSEPTAEVARQTRECRPSALRVVPNGIDLARFGKDDAGRAAVRAELGIPADAWVVGTVGRLWPEKDHPFFLRAVEPLLGDRFHVLIAGDGPEAGRTAALVASMRVPTSIHLLGPRHDIPRVLAALDTFVLSSVREGLPLVIPEAMACELPVVATSVGGIPQVVVEGETGFLVSSGDEAALRERISRLDRDRAEAVNFGRAGRQRALERFSSRRMVNDYFDLYQKALRR